MSSKDDETSTSKSTQTEEQYFVYMDQQAAISPLSTTEQTDKLDESNMTIMTIPNALENESPFFILLNHISHHLFTFLEIEDLIKLRLVSKKIKKIVKSFLITELSFLCKGVQVGSKGLWFSTNQCIDFRYTFTDLRLLVRKNLPINVMFLKRLRIDMLGLISLNVINLFKTLEILEIRFNFSRRNESLQLPALVSLMIKIGEYDQTNVLINAPALKNLYFADYFSLERKNYLNFADRFFFVDPGTVTYLKVDMYLEAYRVFANLETLECLDCSGLHNRLQTHLVHLKKLKILYYDTDQFRTSNGERVDRLKELLKVKRSNLTVICNGFKIESRSDLQKYDGGYVLKKQAQYYQDLSDNLDHIVVFDYDSLLEYMGYTINDRLFIKFNNIKELLVCRPVFDEIHLLVFIRECRNLEKLYLLNTSLKQPFFDQLPVACNLLDLEIEGQSKLNYDFIMRLPYLVELTTCTDFEITPRMNFNKLKHLKRITFDMVDKMFTISKIKCDRYLLPDADHTQLKYRELVEHVNSQRLYAKLKKLSIRN